MSKQITIALIKPSPYQPRLTFDLEDIRGSIQKDGILVALTVREKGGFYELIDGERRLRLAKDLGYETVKCDVVDVSDEVARRMVWKVNTLRKDYTPKEKAYHFKKLQKMGMSVRGIARECDYSDTLVRAYLTIFKLPQKYQSYVWLGKIGIGHLIELSPLFNGGTAKYLARILEHLDTVIERKLGQKELRSILGDDFKEIERKRVESAKKAVGKITTQVKEPESPEELDKAVQALKREAKKKREAQLSDEEKAKQEAEKQQKKEEHKRKRKEKKRKEEEKRKKREEGIRKQAEKEAKDKLLQDKQFIEEAAKLAPQIEKDESPKADLPFDSSAPKSDQIVKEMVKELVPAIKAAFADIPPDNPHDPERNKLVLNMILKNLQQGLVFCPVCGQRMLECSHCHTSLEKMKEEQKL